MQRHPGNTYRPSRSSHFRAMVILTVAIIGIAFCGMIAQIAPRPRPQVLPIVHTDAPADVAPQFRASAAG
jgi:hypothetical protein